VVFHYDSPHDKNRIYINTDLKSYAAKTITSKKIADAANSMILAMDCANRSKEWQTRYVGLDENFDVHGMLFVYNHDSEYDRNWSQLIADAKIHTSAINGTLNRRLYILGPKDIEYLVSVADDIKRDRGNEVLPKSKDCWFFYPDLTISKVKKTENSSASIELLTAPWMLLGYRGQTDKGYIQGYYCYYKGKGDTTEEFMFLIDYFFRTQRVGDENIITIKCPFATSEANSNFSNAKERYFVDHHSLKEFRSRLDRIKFEPLTKIRQTFSEEQLGMED
jgi:hypothetical protein